jgi:hypothetical protein
VTAELEPRRAIPPVAEKVAAECLPARLDKEEHGERLRGVGAVVTALVNAVLTFVVVAAQLSA